MNIHLKDRRKDTRLSQWKPWFPRVYKARGLTRAYWLFWSLHIYSETTT